MAKSAYLESTYFLRVGAEYLHKSAIPDAYHQITIARNDNIIREAFVHFMWDESGTIDGGRIAIGLLKNRSTLDDATSCKFEIYKISNDATPWMDTLVKSGTLAIGANKLFTTTLNSTEAGTDMQGDVTFRIKAKIKFKNKMFYVNEYFNHIGLTDKVERLRKKVTFLQITKKDVGQ